MKQGSGSQRVVAFCNLTTNGVSYGVTGPGCYRKIGEKKTKKQNIHSLGLGVAAEVIHVHVQTFQTGRSCTLSLSLQLATSMCSLGEERGAKWDVYEQGILIPPAVVEKWNLCT